MARQKTQERKEGRGKKQGTRTARGVIPYAILFVAVLLLDQATKALVRHAFALGESRPLVPGLLWLTHATNTGASFSILTGNNTLLIFVALLVLGVLLYAHDSFRTRLEKACYALILGGLLGNLVDRLLLGSVTDFLDLGWFPVFNVADSALVVGVLLLVGYELWGKRRSSTAF